MKSLITKNSQTTISVGKCLARFLKEGDIICFFGDLGSGKTTMIKGIAQGLSIDQKKVNSPTFVLMNAYQGRLALYHFDFYRLEDVDSIHSIGIEEFFYGRGVSVIEWADRLKTCMPAEYLKILIKHKSENERVIRIIPKGKRYQSIASQVKDIET